MKKETPPIIPKISKQAQDKQLHLNIKEPNNQVEIDSVLAEGEAIMSSDESEHTIPRIMTKQELEEKRKRKQDTQNSSLRQIRENFH
jgi:hypothetical protein